MPICEGDQIAVAVTFERDVGHEFGPPMIELCGAIVSLLGPILDCKRRQERCFWPKPGHALSGHVKQLFGPRRPLLKLWTAVAMAIVCVLTLGSGNYRISAPAMIEGVVQRVVVAPSDGYIVEANARAQFLAPLDRIIVSGDLSQALGSPVERGDSRASGARIGSGGF